MKDVAAEAGVSKALVSLVFREVPGPSEATRAHVFAVAERMGYRANRTASLLARRRARLLGVSMSVRSMFHADLVEQLQVAAEEAGYGVVLSTISPAGGERRAVETLLEFRCEALILLGPELPAADLVDLAGQAPLIAVGRRLSMAPAGAEAGPVALDVVRTSDDEGLGRVVDHLVELGHRRICYVGPAEGDIAQDRRNGYRAAMRRHGLERQAQVVTTAATEAGGLEAATRSAAGPHPPTAVAAFNDRCAVGLLDGFDLVGLAVPGQVSVVGYDDSPVARLRRIDLTSVSQEAPAQARLAVRAAVERLDHGRATPTESVLQARLVIRGSTAGPA
jgi:DNA-binding LacI/PurR family transcriptional regulator